MYIKGMNDKMGPDGLVPNLLVFVAFLTLPVTNMNPPISAGTDRRSEYDAHRSVHNCGYPTNLASTPLVNLPPMF